MTDDNPTIWQLAEWDIEDSSPIKHVNHEDIRRFLYLTSLGFAKPEDWSSFNSSPYISNQNFIADFKDILTAFPASNLTYSTEQHETDVEWPDILPGSTMCFHDGSFSYNLSSISFASDAYGEFVFALGSQEMEPCLFGQTGTTIYVTGVTESWYAVEDDFRPGTPFKINSTNSGWNQANNDFYRVKSTRVSGGYLFVKVDYGHKAERRQLEACSSWTGSVSASCNFGGDWWIFRGNNGSASDAHASHDMTTALNALSTDGTNYTNSLTKSGTLWSAKDLYHRYPLDGTSLKRGPSDGRPPTGGILAADYNSDWVRGFNPCAYHCFDENAHRFFIDGDWQGSRSLGDFSIFSAVIPSSDYLPTQVDPKENNEPKWYTGDSASKWVYKDKSQLKALQITDPTNLGPYQECIETGYSTGTGDDDHHGRSWSKQYQEAHAVTYGSYGELTEAGYHPAQHATTTWGPQWEQGKYNGAIQNMLEFVAQGSRDWVLEPDDDYKNNWVWFNYNNPAPTAQIDYLESKYSMPTGKSTYGDIYDWGGVDRAWLPKINSGQSQFVSVTDVYWGENESAIELLLKKLGPTHYDWVFDTDTPWTWSHVLNEKWEVKQDTGSYNGGSTINGVTGITTWEENAEARYPTVAGTWRRTFKYSLGHYENVKIKSGTATDPTGMQSYWYANDDIRMPGRSVVSYSGEPDQHTNADAYDVPNITDFGPNSYSCTVDGTTITITGDVTIILKEGFIVWTVNNAALNAVDATTTEYRVERVKYDSVENETVAKMSGTLNQTTLYFDNAINDRHQANTGTPAYRARVYLILNQVRDALNLLTTAQSAVTNHGIARAISGSNNINGWPDAYWYSWTALTDSTMPVKEVVRAMYASQASSYATNYPSGISDWTIGSGAAADAGTVGQGWEALFDDVNGWWEGGLVIYRCGLIVDTNTYQSILGASPFEGNQTTWVKMKVTGGGAGLAPVSYDYDSGTGIYSNFQQEAHDPVFYLKDGSSYGSEFLYEHLNGGYYANYEAPTEYVYIPLTKNNIGGSIEVAGENKSVIVFLPPWGANNMQAPQSGSAGDADACMYEVNLEIMNAPLCAEIDWTLYNNCAFKRLYERADILSGDLGDTTPPVPDARFIQGPFLYDDNLIYANGGHSSYEDDDYVADWKIKAYTNLVQDEAGHGELYDYTLESVEDETFLSGMTEFLTAMDSADDGYKYDKSLDLTDNTLGQINSMLVYSDLYLTCAVHDNYGTISGGAEEDNYQDTINSDALELDGYTMFFPHKAVISSIARTTPNGTVWRDEVTFSAPLWNSSASAGYQVESTVDGNTWISSVQTGTTYYGAYFLGALGDRTYRVRFYEQSKNIPGQWSDPETKSNP